MLSPSHAGYGYGYFTPGGIATPAPAQYFPNPAQPTQAACTDVQRVAKPPPTVALAVLDSVDSGRVALPSKKKGQKERKGMTSETMDQMLRRGVAAAAACAGGVQYDGGR